MSARKRTVRGEAFIPKDEAIPLPETREYWPARRNRAHICFADHKASSDPSNYNLWVDVDKCGQRVTGLALSYSR